MGDRLRSGIARHWRKALSALAHTPTFVAILCLTLFVAMITSWALLKSSEEIRQNAKLLRVETYRNGIVALSDILRISTLVKSISSKGTATPQELQDLETALDILYVRTDNFRNRQLEGPISDLEANAVDQLWRLVDLLDVAHAEGFGALENYNYTTFWARFSETSELARGRLVDYLDQADQRQDKLLEQRARDVVQQAHRQVAFSLGFAILLLLIILALRAEALEKASREAAEERARYLAYYDALTDLPNRTTFQETATRILEERKDCAAFLLDLDSFKGINDTLGHEAGDAVLKETADRLRSIFERAGGVVARLSGDEFAGWVCGKSSSQLIDIGADIVR
ncbi:MAG: GGDEF domain-containing protein, partial [Pseudomonadota bacterium]